MRWRLEGTNWEGRRWKVSEAIRMLAEQVDAIYPEGDGADGTVASEGHDKISPTSDHRPNPYTGPGIVRAIDIGGGEEVDEIVEAIRLSHDSRVKYAIRYGRIFTSYPVGSRPAWQWGAYSGDNPHNTHAHVSVLSSGDGNATLWEIGDSEMEKIAKPSWLPVETLQRLVARGIINSIPTSETLDVWRTYAMLNRILDAIDGAPGDGFEFGTVVRLVKP